MNFEKTVSRIHIIIFKNIILQIDLYHQIIFVPRNLDPSRASDNFLSPSCRAPWSCDRQWLRLVHPISYQPPGIAFLV